MPLLVARARQLVHRAVHRGHQRVDHALHAVELRRRCCSPSNRPDALPAELTPLDLVPMGNYAVSVRWSDGHQSLLPYRSFVEGYGE